ncbi:MAG: 2,3,4,5-tetrahydropyridine-2,6-dicarboxylate N-succinyltransferase, partial [Candidatus Kapaibacteriota bacterium]
VIFTSSTKVYDIVSDKIYQSTSSRPLEIPENAVVVSGSRTISTDFAKIHGLSIYTPIIIKYRDEKTNAKSALEQLLR